ncbi:MAG: hypothetical protein V1720_04725 [bacterium]
MPHNFFNPTKNGGHMLLYRFDFGVQNRQPTAKIYFFPFLSTCERIWSDEKHSKFLIKFQNPL